MFYLERQCIPHDFSVYGLLGLHNDLCQISPTGFILLTSVSLARKYELISHGTFCPFLSDPYELLQPFNLTCLEHICKAILHPSCHKHSFLCRFLFLHLSLSRAKNAVLWGETSINLMIIRNGRIFCQRFPRETQKQLEAFWCSQRLCVVYNTSFGIRSFSSVLQL